MKENMEEIILKELFKLSDKVDKMATKEDLVDLEKRMTGEMDRRFEEQDAKIEKRFQEQAEELSVIIRDTFKTSTKIHNEMEIRIQKVTDKKIKNLKSQLACIKN